MIQKNPLTFPAIGDDPAESQVPTQPEVYTASSSTTEPVLRRCRKKTTPKQITQENNISVADFTPQPNPQSVQHAITHTTALVTRGDLIATSKYYKHHESLGHLPKRIKQINTNHKKRLLLDSCLPITTANTQNVFVSGQIHSVQQNKNKQA